MVFRALSGTHFWAGSRERHLSYWRNWISKSSLGPDHSRANLLRQDEASNQQFRNKRGDTLVTTIIVLDGPSRITIEALDARQHCDVVHCRSNE